MSLKECFQFHIVNITNPWLFLSITSSEKGKVEIQVGLTGEHFSRKDITVDIGAANTPTVFRLQLPCRGNYEFNLSPYNNEVCKYQIFNTYDRLIGQGECSLQNAVLKPRPPHVPFLPTNSVPRLTSLSASPDYSGIMNRYLGATDSGKQRADYNQQIQPWIVTSVFCILFFLLLVLMVTVWRRSRRSRNDQSVEVSRIENTSKSLDSISDFKKSFERRFHHTSQSSSDTFVYFADELETGTLIPAQSNQLRIDSSFMSRHLIEPSRG